MLFRSLGLTLWAGRLPVAVDFALQCALLFWLVAMLASRRAALASVIIFAGFQIADPTFLTAQHRRDSGTLALAGICTAIRFRSNGGALASGALLAAAVWCTPLKFSAPTAAMVNATAVQAFELDDIGPGGHSDPVTLGSALALAPHASQSGNPLTGAALINALVKKGADVNAKMTRGMPQLNMVNGGGAWPPHSGATPQGNGPNSLATPSPVTSTRTRFMYPTASPYASSSTIS